MGVVDSHGGVIGLSGMVRTAGREVPLRGGQWVLSVRTAGSDVHDWTQEVLVQLAEEERLGLFLGWIAGQLRVYRRFVVVLSFRPLHSVSVLLR